MACLERLFLANIAINIIGCVSSYRFHVRMGRSRGACSAHVDFAFLAWQRLPGAHARGEQAELLKSMAALALLLFH